MGSGDIEDGLESVWMACVGLWLGQTGVAPRRYMDGCGWHVDRLELYPGGV